MARILITCFGSLGDLHPYLAMGAGLRRRRHVVEIATSEVYRSAVTAAGLGFVPLRTALDRYVDVETAAPFIERIFEPRGGPQALVRAMMAGFADTYRDTREAAAGCDLVISHPLSYAAPIVCTELGKRWLSTALSPMSFMSAYDPPFLAAAPWLQTLRAVSPALFRGVFRLAKLGARTLVRPVYEQCRARALAPPRGNPLFEGQFSPYGTLALFPGWFADPQPDWPVGTVSTGFPFHSHDQTEPHNRIRLTTFLASGAAPLVFALGSSAVEISQDFFPAAARIAQALGCRAVLVVGSQVERHRALEADPALIVLDYVAYDELFPHASLIVHQGGIGTLARATRAGKPMLIVPFGFDQFDNAERMLKRGLACTVQRAHFTVDRVVPILAGMLADTAIAQRAVAAGVRLGAEKGVDNACDAVEACIAS